MLLIPANDPLTRYIIDHYFNLMTVDEIRVHKALVGQLKGQAAQSPEMQAAVTRAMGVGAVDIQASVDLGSEVFLRGVRDRILREHADKVFLNYCPVCHALARTPAARQCPKCFHSWHASTPTS